MSADFTRRDFVAGAAALLIVNRLPGQRGNQTDSCWPTQGWNACQAKNTTVQTTKLRRLMDSTARRKLGVKGLLVVQGGALVFEQYAPGITAEDRPNIYSCTKSIVSLLTGIVLEQGLLPGVDAYVLDLLPQHAAHIGNRDPRKQRITLAHLLTMAAGLDWPEWTPWSARHPLVQMERSQDRAQYVLDRPMATEPGTEWHYNSGIPQVISAMIQEAAGMSLQEYAVANLFGPLGIADFSWPTDPAGVNVGGYGLRLTARDLAKIGLLCLRGGQWEDRQLVPKAWLRESTQRYFTADPADRGYGYLWWLPSFGGYAAIGYGGHRVYILPEKDMVVVLTAEMTERDMTQAPEELMGKWVLGR